MKCTLNLIDVRDVAHGLALVMEQGQPGRRYVLGNENLTLGGLFEILSELTGVPVPAVAGSVRAGASLCVVIGAVGFLGQRSLARGDGDRRASGEADHALRHVAYCEGARVPWRCARSGSHSPIWFSG